MKRNDEKIQKKKSFLLAFSFYLGSCIICDGGIDHPYMYIIHITLFYSPYHFICLDADAHSIQINVYLKRHQTDSLYISCYIFKGLYAKKGSSLYYIHNTPYNIC